MTTTTSSSKFLALTTPAGACTLPDPHYEELKPVFPPAIDNLFRSPLTFLIRLLLQKAHGLDTLLYVWQIEWSKNYTQVFDALWKLYETFPKVIRASICVLCMCILPSAMKSFCKCLSSDDNATTAGTSLRATTKRLRMGPSRMDKAHMFIVNFIWLIILFFMAVSLFVCITANNVMARTVLNLHNFSKIVEKQYQEYRLDIYTTTSCTSAEHTKLVWDSLEPIYQGCVSSLLADLNDPLFSAIDTNAVSNYLAVLPKLYSESLHLQLSGTVLNVESENIQVLLATALSEADAVQTDCDDGGAARAFCNDLKNSYAALNSTSFTFHVEDITKHVNTLKDLILQGNDVVLLQGISDYVTMRQDPEQFLLGRIPHANITAAALDTGLEYISSHIQASSILGDVTYLTSWAASLLTNLEGVLAATVSYVYLLNIVHLTGMTICWFFAFMSAIAGLFGSTQPGLLDKRTATSLMHISTFVHEVLAFQIFFASSMFVFVGVIGERSICDAMRDIRDENMLNFLRYMEESSWYNWATQLPDIMDRCNKGLPMYEVMIGENTDTLVAQAASDEVSNALRHLQSAVYPSNSRLYDGLLTGLLSENTLLLFNETLGLPVAELGQQGNASLEAIVDNRMQLLHTVADNFFHYYQALPDPNDQRQQEQQRMIEKIAQLVRRTANQMHVIKDVTSTFNSQAATVARFNAVPARNAAAMQYATMNALHNTLENATSTHCLRDDGARALKEIGQSMQYTLLHKTGKCAYLSYAFNLTVYMLCDQIVLPLNYYWVGMILFCIGFMLSMAIGFDLKHLYRRMVGPSMLMDDV
ncbi:uncharacterized protein LOC135393416 [Ornithodoros turicata]|uniref:uncharacterized protein LOC135393416 n=1 Tax=Ornithodoros turicata TaxID=34597 RepID=UPI003138BCED